MVMAFIPSPSRSSWQFGPIPVRAYALCFVAGILVAVWLANRRYLRTGGRPGMILDAATWAVPFGLVGARIYSVVTDYELYFGPGRDWTDIFRIWNGGIGIPGAIGAGAVGAWLACRRAGVSLATVAGAAAPAIPVGQAIGRWGNWFNQELYGRPSTLPWAVEIDPAHRIPGYENYATFQPAFLYESLWDLVVAAAVIWATRRFLLTGDRSFAVYAGTYAVGRYGTESLRIDYAHHLLGLRINQWLMAAVFAAAVIYLYLTRHQRNPDVIASPAPARTPAPAALVLPPQDGGSGGAAPGAGSGGAAPGAGSGSPGAAGPAGSHVQSRSEVSPPEQDGHESCSGAISM
jgi:prolipoprotein diacylglyceryl transferase